MTRISIQGRSKNLQTQYTTKEIADKLALTEDNLRDVQAANISLLEVIDKLNLEIIAYRKNLSKSVVRRLDFMLEKVTPENIHEEIT